MDLFSVLELIGGLALFLYGMTFMGDGLKKLAGGRLESVLSKLTSNRIIGFFLGFFVTGVIQSSSATIVMLVGFVNSGLMRLAQTTGVIMGANLGTTVTAWILSLSDITGDSIIIKLCKPESFTPILAAIGIILTMFSKSDKKKDIGSILLGFAILMFGMSAMSSAMSGLKDDPNFTKLLTMFSNPIIGILIGVLITSVLQSSSASVGILQALSVTGAIQYNIAIPIILGMNIGAVVPILLSSLSGSKEAKKVAVLTLYIKVIGVIIVAGVFYILDSAMDFGIMDKNINMMEIAVVHTLFNIFSTVILMPFCKALEKLTDVTVGAAAQESPDVLFSTLDERFLTIPGFAVEKSRELVCKMAEKARDSFIASSGLFADYDEQTVSAIYEDEDLVDKFEDKISTYLVTLAGKKLLVKDSKTVTELLHIIGDLERISDHAVNICEVCAEMDSKGIEFSDGAKKDISVISAAVDEILGLTIKAFVDNDTANAKCVEPLEQVIDNLKRKIKNNHIQRLRDGGCTVEMGFILSDLLTNYERVADHCSNIAVCMIESEHGSFDTHEYLNSVKQNGEAEFNTLYEHYKEKYSI